MRALLLLLVRWFLTTLRPRASLQLEVLALRHQISVYQRTCRRPRISPADRILWSYLTRIWAGWRQHLLFVKPDTIIAWQRIRFRDHWRRLSQAGRPGRPPIAKELRDPCNRQSSGMSSSYPMSAAFNITTSGVPPNRRGTPPRRSPCLFHRQSRLPRQGQTPRVASVHLHRPLFAPNRTLSHQPGAFTVVHMPPMCPRAADRSTDEFSGPTGQSFGT